MPTVNGDTAAPAQTGNATADYGAMRPGMRNGNSRPTLNDLASQMAAESRQPAAPAPRQRREARAVNPEHAPAPGTGPLREPGTPDPTENDPKPQQQPPKQPGPDPFEDEDQNEVQARKGLSSPEGGADPFEDGDEGEFDDQGQPVARRAVEPPDDFKVKIGDVEVPYAEVKRGFLRQADYSKKTAEVAEMRKQIEVERQQVLPVAMVMLEHLIPVPDEPPIGMFQQDPVQYATQRAARETALEQRKMLGDAVQVMQARQMQAQQQAHQQMLAQSQQRLLEIYPDWKQPENAKKGMGEVAEELRHRGFDDTEINAIADYRVIPIIRDAIAYRRLKANGLEQKRVPTQGTGQPGQGPAPRPMAPGGRGGAGAPPPPRQPAREVTGAMQAFQRSGKLSDAVAALTAQQRASQNNGRRGR